MNCGQEITTVSAIIPALHLLILHIPPILFALAITKRFLPLKDAAEKALSTFTIYILSIASITWALPGISFITMMGGSIVLLAIAIVLFLTSPSPASSHAPPDRYRIAGWAGIMLFMIVVLLTGIFHPTIEHDPMTYQLHFPAVWLQEGRISIVPTPYGDPSQAYGPALASIYYLWLMAPLGTDMLALTGQWPFMIICCLAAAGLVREMGLDKRYDWAAPLFLFMSPMFVHEGASALSDLAVAGPLAASAYFFVRAIREKGAFHLFLALASAGMAAGGKYSGALLGIVLFPLIILALFRMWPARNITAWVVGVYFAVMGGLIWYIRNAIAARNPLYPIEVDLPLGFTLPGLYGREEMLSWVFHREGVSEWWQTVLTDFNVHWVLLLVPALLVLGIRTLRGQDDEGASCRLSDDVACPDRLGKFLIIYVAVLPFIIDRLLWNMSPYQEYRFWMTAAPFGAALLAAGFSCRPWLLAVSSVAAYAGIFTMSASSAGYGGADRLVMIALPAAFLIGAGAVLGLSVKAAFLKLFKAFIDKAWLPVSLAAILLLVLSALPSYLDRRDIELEWWGFSDAWKALPCKEGGVTVAYSGSNIPYPLHGQLLDNRVLYVSPSGRVMPMAHEVADELGERLPDFSTPEPAVDALVLCERMWVASLSDEGVDYVLITRLPANELLNHAHTKDGFPWENKWARENPSLFTPVSSGNHAFLYKSCIERRSCTHV